jgi:hypothetical protein
MLTELFPMRIFFKKSLLQGSYFPPVAEESSYDELDNSKPVFVSNGKKES